MPKTQIIRDHHLWTRDTIKNAHGNVTLDIDGHLALDPSTGITKFYKSGNTDNYSSLTVGTDGVTTLATHQSGEVTGPANLIFDAQGDIELNADGGDIVFKDDTTQLLAIDTNGDIALLRNMTVGGTLTQRGAVSLGLSGNTTATTMSVVTNTGTYAGKNLTVSAGSTTTGANNINGGDLVLASGGGDGTGTSSIQFQTKVSGTDAVAERMRIHTDGNIGIGTASPAVNLDIEDITTSSASQGGNLRLGSNDGAVMASGHRLGVLEFAGAEDTSSTMTVGARIEAVTDATWSASENGAILNFYTTDGNASQTQQMTILAAGNVGIGVADPDTTLEVNGNTKITHTGTTTHGLEIDATALTTGSALYLDTADSLTASATKYLEVINYAKSGVTASGQHSQTTGLVVSLNDAATNHASSVVTMVGALIGVDSANAQGDISQTGLDVQVAIDGVGDAADTYGMKMRVMDGGTDIIMKSSADASDYCSISTTTSGATTIATVDSDDAEAAHLTFDIQGDTIFKGDIADGTSTEVARIDASASSLFMASGKKIEYGHADEYISGNATDLTIASGGHLDLAVTGEVDFNTTTVGFTAQAGTDAVSIDWGEGNKYHLLMENNSTVTFATNPTNPCNLLLKVAQGNGGSKVITWAVTSGTIYWAGGGILNTDEPTLTTTDDKTDILSFYFDGTNYFGVASLNFDTT